MNNILVASFFCLGVYTSIQEGMIFEFVGHFVDKINDRYNHPWILKPFATCFVCMGSVWGGICFALLQVSILEYWQLIAVVGVNRLFNHFGNIRFSLDSIKELLNIRYEEEQ